MLEIKSRHLTWGGQGKVGKYFKCKKFLRNIIFILGIQIAMH